QRAGLPALEEAHHRRHALRPACDVDVVGARFLEGETDELPAALDRRPVVQLDGTLVCHSLLAYPKRPGPRSRSQRTRAHALAVALLAPRPAGRHALARRYVCRDTRRESARRERSRARSAPIQRQPVTTSATRRTSSTTSVSASGHGRLPRVRA